MAWCGQQTSQPPALRFSRPTGPGSRSSGTVPSRARRASRERAPRSPYGGSVGWNGKVPAWTSDLQQPPSRIVLHDNGRGGPHRRYDWESPRLEHDELVMIAPSRVRQVSRSRQRPAERLVARVVVPAVGEMPLERGAGVLRRRVTRPRRARLARSLLVRRARQPDSPRATPSRSAGSSPSGETTIATTLCSRRHDPRRQRRGGCQRSRRRTRLSSA